MRDIPGLKTELLARATELSIKARDARQTTPGAPEPKSSIAPATVRDGVATLRLYDYIDGEGGYWGISAGEVAEALGNVDENVNRLELLVNSGGGSVWDGLAILNELRDFDAPVTARVFGIAASAASFIAVACDEVVMEPNSRMMIHDAMGLCMGQAADMRAYADFLDDSSDGIAEIYAERTGGTVQDWRDTMMAKGLLGQWYSAQEAVDAGLADRVGGASDADTAEPTVEDRLKAGLATVNDMREAAGVPPLQTPEIADTAAKASDVAKSRQMRNRNIGSRHGLKPRAA